MKYHNIFKNTASWDDMHANIQQLPTTKEQGDAFEWFCYLFLKEREEYEEVWLQKDIPHSIGKKLKLDGTDHGVDLLVKDRYDRYAGVQCKWRSDSTKALRWSADKLANIFAHGALDRYIIFSNADRVDTYTQKQIGNKLITFLYNALSELDTEKFANYRRIAQKKPTKPNVYTPRPHQKKAIEHVVAGLKKEDRGKLILPCGAGKTLTAFWIKEKMKPKRTVVLVPSLSLLRQIKEEWREQQRVLPYFCVCSEKDIDMNYGDDILNNTPSDIGSTGIGVFRDKKEIQKQIKKQKGDLVVFATYQSADKLKGIPFDLAICDEAHKTATQKRSNFTLIHDDKNIPCKKRLYMTATPRVTGNIKEGKGGEDNITEYIADMNNEKEFGKELHRMSFKEAIDQGILCDYKIILLETTEKVTKEVKRGSAISEESLYHIYNQTAKKYKTQKAITFHGSIQHAQDFEEKLQQENVNAYHINGKQNTSQRARILKEFAENTKKSVITNARCLTEGIDVPTIDMVYFCSRRTSKIDIVQIVGRALRKAQDKTHGYILIPIVHKKEKQMTKEYHQDTYEGDYKEVIAVLRAMQDHDDRLAEEIHRRHLKRHKPDRNSIIQAHDINITKEVTIAAKDIHPYILRKTTPSHFLPFEEARAYVQGLGLKNQKEWGGYCKSGKKPNDIPSTPSRTYKDDGWMSWGDWLGTGTVASKNMVYRPFKEARTFVHKLRLKSTKEWGEYCKSGKKPNDIPSRPDKTYKDDGWIGMGDWLGTGTIANFNRVYRPFKEARVYVQGLGLKNHKEWGGYCKSGKKPNDIPSTPSRTYKDKGWKDWSDWLGKQK